MERKVVQMGNITINVNAEPFVSITKADFYKSYQGKVRGANIDDLWNEVQKRRPRKPKKVTKESKTEED